MPNGQTPPSWKNVPAKVKHKAAEILDALLKGGMPEDKAIPIALSRARQAVKEAKIMTQPVCPLCGEPVDGSMADHKKMHYSKEELAEIENFDPDGTEFDIDDIEERVLTTKARKDLASSDFALPGGRYPIPDEAHARNALARASQMLKAGKLSRADYNTIVNKVKRRFPKINVSESGSQPTPKMQHQMTEDVDLEVRPLGPARSERFVEEVRILEDKGTGTEWKVVLVAPGVSKNRTYYSPSLLQKKANLFEGVKCYADHDENNPVNRSIKEVVGWYDNVQYEHGKGLTATFHALESQPWFSGMIKEAFDRNKPDLFGFSLNGLGSKRLGKVNNETCYVVEDLQKIDSVDAVTNPSAGGKVLRMVAGMDQSREEIELIENMTLEELKEARPDLFEKVNEQVASKEAEIAKIQEALDTAKAEAESAAAKLTELEANNKTPEQISESEEEKNKMNTEVSRLEEEMKAQAEKLNEMVRKAEEQAQIATCKNVLAEKLQESELPAPVQKKLERKYAGKIFDVETLTEDINEEKDVLAKLMDSQVPFSRTSTNITVGDNQRDRAVKALDGFFDGKAVDGVAPARSLMEAYCIFTGRNSWEVRPDQLIKEAAQQYDSGTRLTEALSAATWSSVLGDSITRKLLAEYNSPGYDEWRQFVEVSTVNDFRTQRRERFGGYGLLPTVSEAASYTAMTSPSDEEATFSPSKRGGTENITLEMIAKDDVGSIRRLPVKLARAAKITLYQFVFDMMSLSSAESSTTYDSSKLFTTAHANSLTTVTGNLDVPLNDANMTTAKQKMAKQAAFGESTNIIGLRPRFLVVPVELEATAIRMRDNEYTASLPTTPSGAAYSQSDVNVHRGSFQIVTVPYWGDDKQGRSDRWIMVADPNDVPTIEIGFFQGRQEPELFTQDMETVGSMFTNDTVTYKIRHIYGGTILDHRGFVGSALYA